MFALGVANGAFAVSAIGSMMALASAGHESREGLRMGLWGGAQAIAFAAGGVVGTAAVDIARHLFAGPALAYTVVFAAEAVVFLVAARLAADVSAPARAAIHCPRRFGYPRESAKHEHARHRWGLRRRRGRRRTGRRHGGM